MTVGLFPHAPISLDESIRAYQEIVVKFGFTPMVQPGRMQLLGWDLEYVCGATLASFIDSTLVRRLNDFVPDNDHPLILDCGANIGFTVLNYKRQFPQARIIAFEPDPHFAPLLRRNLERNGAADVQVVEAAAWIRDGKARWLCEGIDGSKIIDSKRNATNVISVQTVDLAHYISKNVDLLKLDIEGAEYAVVARLGKRLRNVKNILIECHLDQSTIMPFGALLKVLAAAGFKLSVNSFGAWRDLIRQSPVLANHWEQYLLVAGWRDVLSAASAEDSALPYTGARPEVVLRAERAEIQERRNALALMRSDLQSSRAMLLTREAELAARERQLLQSLYTYHVSGRQALETRVATPPFTGQGELGWTVPLPDLEPCADDEPNPTRSSLLLFENETLLGPAHSLHADISNAGGGRFSHWSTHLYFSTSDNSDPNTNGRTYTLVFVNAARESELDAREQDVAQREASIIQREALLAQREVEMAGREPEG